MVKAMTFNELDPLRVDLLLDDDRFALEPKYDGVRTLVVIDAAGVRLTNRTGAPLAAASTNKHRAPLIAAFEAMGFKGDWVFDGELLDDGVLIVFDLPQARSDAGYVFTNSSSTYEDRREVLERLAEMADWGSPGSLVRLATQVRGSDKRVLHDTILETGGEGAMLKRLDARYEERRTKTAGFKVKFCRTVDVIIGDTFIDGKENASLLLACGAEIAHCSLIGKPPVKPGDVVEVKFLYVGANGRLVQPRLMRVRGDKAAADCTADQLVGAGVKKWAA